MRFHNMRMTGLLPAKEHERPLDDVWKANIRCWCCLPLDVRERCLAELRGRVGPETMGRWRDQSRRGMRVGSDDPRFHFGVGMEVRNILRQAATDDVLPTGNWDDYYYGAVERSYEKEETSHVRLHLRTHSRGQP